MEEEPAFLRCSEQNHKWRGSKYPQDRVPREFFVKNGKLLKTCDDCRTYAKKKQSRLKKRRADAIAANPDAQLFKCKTCNALRAKNYCPKCSQRGQNTYKNQKDSLKQLMWENIQEKRHCCERCKLVFLKQKDGEPGFVTVGHLDGVTKEDIEFRNLEFDHLGVREQIEKKGEFAGEKYKKLSRVWSYTAQKLETKKCQLLCLLCHRIVSRQREKDENRKRRTKREEKTKYVKEAKVDVGACYICGFAVSSEITSYFEFLRPGLANEGDCIADMVSKDEYSLENVASEISKCALACAFCRRTRSSEQSRERSALKRRKAEYEELLAQSGQ